MQDLVLGVYELVTLFLSWNHYNCNPIVILKIAWEISYSMPGPIAPLDQNTCFLFCIEGPGTLPLAQNNNSGNHYAKIRKSWDIKTRLTQLEITEETSDLSILQAAADCSATLASTTSQPTVSTSRAPSLVSSLASCLAFQPSYWDRKHDKGNYPSISSSFDRGEVRRSVKQYNHSHHQTLSGVRCHQVLLFHSHFVSLCQIFHK